MENERFVKLGNKIIKESDIENMDVYHISELLIDIDASIIDVSEAKKDYMNRFKDNKDNERYQVNIQKFTYLLNRLHEAQGWISIIKKRKNCETYKQNAINKAFLELARVELKEKVFINLYTKAKEIA